ncbi:MAG: hypothetical protein NC452_21115 [Eubacterium sp.]|nr:hypothetical protein [Eubacterium sp.]
MCDTQEDIQHLTELLHSFSCDRDKDIENFLHNRAVEFERLNKSRTYLLCDDDIFRKEGQLVILGYFSVALKVLDFPENISNRTRKMLDGLSAKLRGEVIRSVPCYLIGQLGKNSAVTQGYSIKGSDFIDHALFVIQSAQKFVGGRLVLIECHDEPKLIQFYTDNHFERFGEFPFGDIPMVQMIRTI